MRYKKFILVILFLLCIMSIGVVSASVNIDDTSPISDITGDTDSNIDDNIEVNKIISQDNDVQSSNDESSVKKITSDAKKTATTETFTELYDIIHNSNNSTIYLNDNYSYESSDSAHKHGILIDRDVTIIGNGATINGNGNARLFYVIANDVVFKNINMKNGVIDGNGAGIYGKSTVINCTFTGCYGSTGGVMYNGTAINSTFKDNKADYYGGAIYNGNATNCKFINNIAYQNGGAMYNGAATDCFFDENYAQGKNGADLAGGGAAYNIKAINCTFTNNHVADRRSGGAMYKGTAINCTFEKNWASDIWGHGGGLFNATAINCTFINNSAHSGGGASLIDAIHCVFIDNSVEVEGAGGAMSGSDIVLSKLINNDYYNVKFVSDLFKVKNLNTTYNSSDKLLFNLTYKNYRVDGIDTRIKIYDNENNYLKTVYAKSGEGWTVDLMPGTYNAVLSLDEYPIVNSAKSIITVNKIGTELIIPDFVTIYNYRDYFNVTLKDIFGNPVSNHKINASFNMKTQTYTTNKDGIISLSTFGLNAGSYYVYFNYGDDIYSGAEKEGIIVVIRDNATITAKNFTKTVFGVNNNIAVTLKDSKNVTISDAILEVNIDYPVTYRTNKYGQILVPTKDLPAGNYSAKIIFDGDKNHKSTSKVITVLVAKTSSINATKVIDGIRATLKDNYGEAIPDAIIQTTANNMTYKTNTNGQVMIPYSDLPEDTKTIFIYYRGNESINASYTQLNNITVNTPYTVATEDTYGYAGEKIILDAYVTYNNDDKTINEGYIYFRINGNSLMDMQTRRTFLKVEDNVVHLEYAIPENMKPGSYPLIATYVTTGIHVEDHKTFTLLEGMPTGADGEDVEDESYQPRINYNKKTIHSNKNTIIKNTNNKSLKVIHKNTVVSQDNVLTLGELNTIFNQTFTNGHLMVYIDGQLVFNSSVTDDISTIIFEIVEKYLGVHELKVEYTDSENNTNTYTENVTIN